MVDTNKILVFANVNITRKQNILGLIVNVNDENRIYFANISIGNSITSRDSDQSRYAREYLVNSISNSTSLGLNEILRMAGAEVVASIPNQQTQFLNLSPSALDKTTIINLIKEKSNV